MLAGYSPVLLNPVLDNPRAVRHLSQVPVDAAEPCFGSPVFGPCPEYLFP
jgi:hypothetical protein